MKKRQTQAMSRSGNGSTQGLLAAAKSEQSLGAVHMIHTVAKTRPPETLPAIESRSPPPRSGALLLQSALADHFGGRAELRRQADFARSIGSPFVAAVLEAGERQLHNAPKTASLIANWTGDLAAAAVAMRFNAALHALARSGRIALLSSLYRREHNDFDGAIAQTLREADEEITLFMARPTQTNEVGRAAAILCALMIAREQTGLPFELLELGSSCGLNLNLTHYSYDLAGLKAGNPDSPVHIAPEWRGASLPPLTSIEVIRAQGVDLAPQDPSDPATAERMMSYVWADQNARMEKLAQALHLARTHKPKVDRGTAPVWLSEQLAKPHPRGVCRAIFHSMVLQYLNPEQRHQVIHSILDAGERSGATRPLAWISFEWTQCRSEVRLMLTLWPDGTTHHLASCHPYGAWIDWHGSPI